MPRLFQKGRTKMSEKITVPTKMTEPSEIVKFLNEEVNKSVGPIGLNNKWENTTHRRFELMDEDDIVDAAVKIMNYAESQEKQTIIPGMEPIEPEMYLHLMMKSKNYKNGEDPLFLTLSENNQKKVWGLFKTDKYRVETLLAQPYNFQSEAVLGCLEDASFYIKSVEKLPLAKLASYIMDNEDEGVTIALLHHSDSKEHGIFFKKDKYGQSALDKMSPERQIDAKAIIRKGVVRTNIGPKAVEADPCLRLRGKPTYAQMRMIKYIDLENALGRE